MARQDGTSPGEDIGGQVRGEPGGTGTAIDHPAATWTSSQTKRSHSALKIDSSAALLERWMHVGGDGFNNAVGWGQQKLRCMEN